MEPTKHQYDVDTETVVGFLKTHGLDKDFKVNIEVNHATLAGHTFEHELAVAVDNGMLGSIDANRGDYQNGWSAMRLIMGKPEKRSSKRGRDCNGHHPELRHCRNNLLLPYCSPFLLPFVPAVRC